MRKNNSDEVDKFIALKLKEYRALNNLTQTDLANYLGMTFQQIQKYESAQNKISISNLIKVSELFQCDIKALLPTSCTSKGQYIELYDKETILLIRYWNAVKNKSFRKSILDFIKSISKRY